MVPPSLPRSGRLGGSLEDELCLHAVNDFRSGHNPARCRAGVEREKERKDMRNVVKILRRGADGLVRVAASPKVQKLAVGVVAAVAVAAHASGEDPNETLVDTAVGNLTTTFATIFTLGLGVVIALVAKKYLRRAS